MKTPAVMYLDKEKCLAEMKAAEVSVYRLSKGAGMSSHGFQRLFLPSAPRYHNVHLATINKIAEGLGCSPLRLVSVLGPKYLGGEAPAPLPEEVAQSERNARPRPMPTPR